MPRTMIECHLSRLHERRPRRGCLLCRAERYAPDPVAAPEYLGEMLVFPWHRRHSFLSDAGTRVLERLQRLLEGGAPSRSQIERHVESLDRLIQYAAEQGLYREVATYERIKRLLWDLCGR
jgi:hypothetical protein